MPKRGRPSRRCVILSHLLQTNPAARPTQDALPGLLPETLSVARPTRGKSPGLSFEILSIVWQTSDASHAHPAVSPPELIIRGHADSIYCAVFSVDGKQIVLGSKDRTIRIWDAQTGNPDLTLLEMHTVGVSSVALSSNSRHIASSSKDATILVWHVLTGEVVAGPFKGHRHIDSISSVCFSPRR
jgi:WD40 repeat protein